MEKYQIIPRKFRPKCFSEVAGHESIVATLKNAIQQKRLAQAYLFAGSRGCGKTTLARLLAKALNCSQLTVDSEPCNQCTNCTEISEGRSLDVIEIDGASNRGIEDIRQINETVGYAPSKGHYKIYIIDEVHMLTKEAFNALLKTLEEPPEKVKFFFATTEPHKIPPTIISRCQRLNLARVPQEEIVDKLIRICKQLEVTAEKEALLQISQLSEGSLRDAESLLDQLICFGKTPITYELTREVFGLLKTDQLIALDKAILTGNVEMGIQIASELHASGKDIGACIDSFLEHFRTHLMAHFTRSEALKYTKQQCLTLLDILIQWQQQMLKTPFKKIHLEMLVTTLIRKAAHISLDELITRLIDLEKHFNQDAFSTKKLPASSAPCRNPSSTSTSPSELAPAPRKNSMEKTSIPSGKSSLQKVSEAEKIKEPKEEEKREPKQQQSNPPTGQTVHPSKHDTLIRFAAVELEGSVIQRS